MSITFYNVIVVALLSVFAICMCYCLSFAITFGISSGSEFGESTKLIERRNLEREILALRQQQSKIQ